MDINVHENCIPNLPNTSTHMDRHDNTRNFSELHKCKKIPMVFDETSKNCVFRINLNNNYNPPHYVYYM